ncbi:hypothetical protein EVAR_101733_1 [Eumeta japonica]|uniref:Uncharacterized protein n=1 Tax=Eumeta variegata TaxID=151549 RepID=A0A4C1TEP7_EUMVA|nr:hypothetical protein EVAR_101733_1 [Eumeta japonica]
MGQLLRLSKTELSKMMEVVTGHSQLLAHLNRIGEAEEDECRACGEDSEHHLCHCLAFSQIRSRYCSSDTLSAITQLRGICWRKLRNFTLLVQIQFVAGEFCLLTLVVEYFAMKLVDDFMFTLLTIQFIFTDGKSDP